MNEPTATSSYRPTTSGEAHGAVPLSDVNAFGQAFGAVFGQAINQLHRDMGTHFGNHGQPSGAAGRPTVAVEPPVAVLTPAQKVAPIIARVEDEMDRRTLESVSPRDLQAVGRVVYKAREDYPGISDREIYLKYYQAAACRQDPRPELVEGFKIIKLLMGGYGGKLPF